MSELLSILARAEKFSKNQNYKNICESMLKETDEKKILELNKRLPTDEDLFHALIEKLKNKSVYSRLKDLYENKKIDRDDLRICYSSLLTHVLIECKKNPEYELLIEPTLQKLYLLI